MNTSAIIRVLAILFFTFIIMIPFYVIGRLVSGLEILDPDAPTSSFQEVVMSFFTYLSLVFAVWLFTRYGDNRHFKTNGFSLEGAYKENLWGFWSGTVTITLGFFALFFFGKIVPVGYDFNFREMFLLSVHYLFVAFGEEILFRGYILRNLLLTTNKPIALLVSSIIFAGAHAGNSHFGMIPFIDLTLFGLICGIAYLSTKRLWFPIAFHFSWNFIQSLVGFNVSGQESYKVMKLEMHGADYITGGAFGFEGSILSLLLQAALLLAFLLYLKNNTQILK
jgi:uncharacterized protein